MTRPTWPVAASLFVLLWAVYLLVYSGTLLVIDEQHIFAVGESLAVRGAVDANQVRFAPHILPASGKFGVNGDYHTTHGSALSFLIAPLVLLARRLPQVGAVQASMLLNPLITALTAVLVMFYVQRLYGSRNTGLAAALLYGLCTLALPYAKTLYTEPLSALTLFAAAWALLRYRDRGDLTSLALGSGLAGLAVLSKPTNGIALPAFLLYAAWAFLRRLCTGQPTLRQAMLSTWKMLLQAGLRPAAFALGGRPVRPPAQAGLGGPGRPPRSTNFHPVLAALAFGAPLAAFLAFLGLFNYVRFGNPLDIGHVAYSLQFNTPLWEGLYGLLASPGKSLFLFSPLLLLWPFALPAFLRRHPAEALLSLAVSGSILVLHATYFMWYGGTSWGPRFLVPLVPFFLVGTVPALRWLWSHGSGRIALGLLIAASVAVQFLGVVVKFTHYFSLLERQFPNAETNVSLLFDPRYSPILGHMALALNPHNYNLAWLRGSDGTLYIDWVAVALILALLGCSLVSLFARRWQRPALALALVGAVLTPGFLLARYYDDPRYGGDEAHWALLHRLEVQVAPADAVISHEAAQANFYLNYSHVTASWFGVPRESLPLSAETGALLDRLVRERGRIWLILPHTPPGDPGSGVERWLAERAYPATSEPFGPDLRLASFAVPGPMTWREGDAVLGHAVQLAAYALPDTSPAPGDVLCLALRWRCLAPLPADYTVFVQLLGPAGLPSAQADRRPVAGFRPTSGWRPGDVIEDHHGVPLPPDLPPGDYRLIAGLYRLDTGARLATSAGDFVALGHVAVRTR